MSSDFDSLFPREWRPDEEKRPSREGLPLEPENRIPPVEGLPLEPENRLPRILNEKEVKVVNVFEGIVNSPGTSTPAQVSTFVLLRDNRGREFRIFVVRDVAYAISLALSGDAPDRPYTHDLMKVMLDRMGAKVDHVIIDDLWQDTFYAKIYLLRNGEKETLEIDSRPSDALALALRYRAPIYVAEAVLDAVQSES